MTSRRDLLIGGLCVAAGAAAYAMIPRKRLSLMSNLRLQDVAQNGFGGWVGRDVTDLVAPVDDSSLLSRLYDQTLQRIYANPGALCEVMVLLVHGNTQTNELQLHRPEVCYPAFGYEIVSSQAAALPLTGAAALPVRQLVAQGAGRREDVVYWTRLGEYLPTSVTDQRLDRLKIGFQGYVADGLLARFSAQSVESDQATPVLRAFITDFLRATAAGQRRALIGSRLATAMAST
jgi:EpsI family protein